jgi:hypothetical protein
VVTITGNVRPFAPSFAFVVDELVAVVVIVVAVLVHLGDHCELIGVLEIEEQVDRLSTSACAQGLAPDDG